MSLFQNQLHYTLDMVCLSWLEFIPIRSNNSVSTLGYKKEAAF